MKQILTLLCAFLFAFSVSAQFDDIQWGYVGGLNYAVPVGDDMEDLEEALEDQIDDIDDMNNGDDKGGIYGRLGFHLGVTGEYELKDDLSIVSGLQYSQKGFTQKIEYEYTSYSNYGVNLKQEFEGKARFLLNYLDLPIAVKYDLGNGFSVFGGLLFSFLISEKVNSEYEESNQYDNYGNISTDSDSDSETDDFDDIFDEGDPEGTLSGYQIGVGYEFDTFNVSLKLNKNSNAFETHYGDDNQNITYQLSVGRYF